MLKYGEYNMDMLIKNPDYITLFSRILVSIIIYKFFPFFPVVGSGTGVVIVYNVFILLPCILTVFILIGLLTRFSAILISIIWIVILLENIVPKINVPGLMIALALVLLLVLRGAGKYSLDYLIWGRKKKLE